MASNIFWNFPPRSLGKDHSQFDLRILFNPVVGSVGEYTIPIDPSSDWRLANPQNPTKLATVPTKARGWTRSSQGVDSRGDLEKKGQQQPAVWKMGILPEN